MDQKGGGGSAAVTVTLRQSLMTESDSESELQKVLVSSLSLLFLWAFFYLPRVILSGQNGSIFSSVLYLVYVLLNEYFPEAL